MLETTNYKGYMKQKQKCQAVLKSLVKNVVLKRHICNGIVLRTQKLIAYISEDL